MEHEDFEQHSFLLDNGYQVWVTFCTCHAAFWADTSQRAYDLWADHEADY